MCACLYGCGCVGGCIPVCVGVEEIGVDLLDSLHELLFDRVKTNYLFVCLFQSQKNRVILLKLEEEFVAYIKDTNHKDHLKLPPWDSYHRMLAHRFVLK